MPLIIQILFAISGILLLIYLIVPEDLVVHVEKDEYQKDINIKSLLSTIIWILIIGTMVLHYIIF